MTVIDDALFDDALTLGPIPAVVFLYLDRHANRDGRCSVSYSQLADECHISRRAAINAVSLLVDKKFLAAWTPPDTRESHAPNRYTIPRHHRKASAPDAPALVHELVQDDHQASARASAPGAPLYEVDIRERERERTASVPDDPFPASGEPPMLGPMRVAICEARGIHSLSGTYKATIDALCRTLIEAGATPFDIPHLTFWAERHDFWGNAGGTKTGKGYSVKQLPTIYEQWTSAGKPRRRRSVFRQDVPEAR